MKQADEERRKTKNKQIRQTDRKMERNKKGNTERMKWKTKEDFCWRAIAKLLIQVSNSYESLTVGDWEEKHSGLFDW